MKTSVASGPKPMPPISIRWLVQENSATSLAVLEAGRGDDEVVEMAGAHPGIVGDVGVARLHRLDREMRDEVLDRLRHRIDVARRAGHRLRQHAALEVEHAGREVAAFAHDRAEGGAQQHLRLLLDHGDQPVPHDLQIDQARAARLIHGHAAFRSMTMLPAPSIRASKLVETKVEVSSSAITAGPAMVAARRHLVAVIQRDLDDLPRAAVEELAAARRPFRPACASPRRRATDCAARWSRAPTSSGPRSQRPGSAARTGPHSPPRRPGAGLRDRLPSDRRFGSSTVISWPWPT